MPRREPKAVKALIARHERQSTDAAAIEWLKRAGLYVGGRAIRLRSPEQGGTRGGQREQGR